MEYLCLVYMNEQELATISKREEEMLADESRAYDGELRRKGHTLAAVTLQSSESAITLRIRNHRLLLSAGPSVQTNEQLHTILLIEARDLNEAIQAASKIPLARYGSIEVRPTTPTR
jgi:hypothetical protein